MLLMLLKGVAALTGKRNHLQKDKTDAKDGN